MMVRMSPSNRGVRPVSTPGEPATGRPRRSDAAANRAKILAAAHGAFVAGGFETSLDEIARLAGVGAGTVHRHFPTKAALVDAVLEQSVAELAGEARALADSDDPGGALRSFLERLVAGGAAAHELADRLSHVASDVDAAVAAPVAELGAALEVLLARAKAAGAVRPDLDDAGLAAIVAAGHAAYVHPDGGDRAVAMVLDGLRPVSPRTPTRPG
jgi:AcrR family transcriptional regulator